MFPEEYKLHYFTEDLESAISTLKAVHDITISGLSNVIKSIGLGWSKSVDEINQIVARANYVFTALIQNERLFMDDKMRKRRYEGCIALTEKTMPWLKTITDFQKKLPLETLEVSVAEGLQVSLIKTTKILEDNLANLNGPYILEYLDYVTKVTDTIVSNPSILGEYRMDFNKMVVQEQETHKTKKGATYTLPKLVEKNLALSAVESMEADTKVIFNPLNRNDTAKISMLIENNFANMLPLVTALIAMEKHFFFDILNQINMKTERVYINIKKMVSVISDETNGLTFHKTNITGVRDMVFTVARTLSAFATMTYIYHTTVSSTVNAGILIDKHLNTVN